MKNRMLRTMEYGISNTINSYIYCEQVCQRDKLHRQHSPKGNRFHMSNTICISVLLLFITSIHIFASNEILLLDSLPQFCKDYSTVVVQDSPPLYAKDYTTVVVQNTPPPFGSDYITIIIKPEAVPGEKHIRIMDSLQLGSRNVSTVVVLDTPPVYVKDYSTVVVQTTPPQFGSDYITIVIKTKADPGEKYLVLIVNPFTSLMHGKHALIAALQQLKLLKQLSDKN